MAQVRTRKLKQALAPEPLPPLVLRLAPVVKLSDKQLARLCTLNDALQIERTREGDLVIMPPAFPEGDRQNTEVTGQLFIWARTDGTGISFGPTAGFTLSNGAMRAPDASWILRSRWESLSEAQRLRRFSRICPDFVVEVRSATDRLSVLQAKMQEYLDSGARLGWLIDPVQRQVYVYRPDAAVERLNNPRTLAGDPVLPGFVLELAPIWGP